MFTQETLHHAAIEDIVRDLLSRIEALESAHPDIIIKPNEADAEMEKLKAENKRLEYYDNQLRDKIQKLELNVYHFERIPNISGNSIDKIIVNASEYNSLSHKINDLSSKVEFLEKENAQYKSAFQIADDDNKSLTAQILSSPYFGKEMPQWKNSVKDGLPDFDQDFNRDFSVIVLGKTAIFPTLYNICKIDENPTDAIIEWIGKDFDYFIIPQNQ